MLQPFATTTIVFAIIGVRSKIDNKFELLVVDGSSPEDIQIVDFFVVVFFIKLSNFFITCFNISKFYNLSYRK